MNIDWNEAPEGATHAGTLRGQNRQVFYRDISAYGYEFTYPDLKNWTWMRNMGEPLCSPLIPRGEQQAGISEVEQETRQAIIDLAWKECGVQGDAIRQLATTLVNHGYRKFEIIEEDV